MWFTTSVLSHLRLSNGSNLPNIDSIHYLSAMKYLSLRLVLLPLLALVLGHSGAIAAEPAIIAKARAYIGSEAALNSVKTLHYYGELSIEGTESETPI